MANIDMHPASATEWVIDAIGAYGIKDALKDLGFRYVGATESWEFRAYRTDVAAMAIRMIEAGYELTATGKPVTLDRLRSVQAAMIAKAA